MKHHQLCSIEHIEHWKLIGCCVTDPGHQVKVLLWLAEVEGQGLHAQVLMLAGVEPGTVLLRVRNPLQEDPERLPYGLLADWAQTCCDVCYNKPTVRVDARSRPPRVGWGHLGSTGIRSPYTLFLPWRHPAVLVWSLDTPGSQDTPYARFVCQYFIQRKPTLVLKSPSCQTNWFMNSLFHAERVGQKNMWWCRSSDLVFILLYVFNRMSLCLPVSFNIALSITP